MLTQVGHEFVRKCIQTLEKRGECFTSFLCLLYAVSAGLEEEGIYRKPGVLSKAGALMKDCIGAYTRAVLCLEKYSFSLLERGKLSKLSFDDEIEYDTKTVASAVKMYFG